MLIITQNFDVVAYKKISGVWQPKWNYINITLLPYLHSWLKLVMEVIPAPKI